MLWILPALIFAAVAIDDAGVTLPSAPVQSLPQPADSPTISTIAENEWYVITSVDQLRVLASPIGVVTIEETQGPVKLRGKFAGSSRVETRSYEGKWVYIVTADGPGQCELLLIPQDFAKPEIRQTLTISGSGPRPPPVPDPAPQPAPTPVQPPSGLQVMLLIDQSDPVSALAAVNSVPVLQWLDSSTTPTDGRPGWRRWDRSSLSDPDTLATESQVWRKLWGDIGSGLPAGPQLVIVTGSKVTTRPITTQRQLLQDLQAAKEGKL
jgi:hypothetical protein